MSSTSNNNFFGKYKEKIENRIMKKRLKKYMKQQDRNTSMSDTMLYPSFCYAASQDNLFFKNFRRNEIYNLILEHVTEELGQSYLDIINKNTGLTFSKKDWDEFCKNDLYGNPRMYSYKVNDCERMISPTTVRYAKVLQDIDTLFDVSRIKTAAEIGIGYAGQGRILTSHFSEIGKYCLIDLPEVLALSEKYLGKFGSTDKFRFIDGTTLNSEVECDFVMSNYAFSELIRAVQDIYLQNVILKAKAGYITWNYFPGDGYSVKELLAMIPGSRVIAEEPLTAEQNCIIIWGEK